MRVLDLTMSLRRTKKLDLSVLELLKAGLKNTNKTLDDLKNEDEFVNLILAEADKLVPGKAKLPRFNGTEFRLARRAALEAKRLAIKNAPKTVVSGKRTVAKVK